MARFRLNIRAKADLREAFRHVAENGGVEAAHRLRLRIHDRFTTLAEQPFIGRRRLELDLDLRSHVVPNTRYIIFYYPRDFRVEIVSVFHGSQRLTSLFED